MSDYLEHSIETDLGQFEQFPIPRIVDKVCAERGRTNHLHSSLS